VTTHQITVNDWPKLEPEVLRKLQGHECLLVLARAAHLLADAIEIADESAIAFIEAETLMLETDRGEWHDLNSALDPDQSADFNDQLSKSIEQAARYLAARGKLERRECHPNLVRFT
jgi:hypothetical protein